MEEYSVAQANEEIEPLRNKDRICLSIPLSNQRTNRM